MRALLDTNVLIHREARTVVREDIGTLFRWLDQLQYEKCVHPESLAEIRKHADPDVVRTLEAKLGSYKVFATLSPDTPGIAALRGKDQTENSRTDTSVLNEVAADRVDLLITEDRGIHRKAEALGLTVRVYTIDAFLEKVTAENPDLADYKVLSVRRRRFGEVALTDPFFDSFREDYPGFNRWYTRKADETAYVCSDEQDSLVAFLYLKRESEDENYADIAPPFSAAKRLKIGTLKVLTNGNKLGERFLKIVFDNAVRFDAQEIYVTLFRKTAEQDRLVRLLEDWGFHCHGHKVSAAGAEHVYVRPLRRSADRDDPRLSYPFMSRTARKFIVPIYPEYHTELLPDSILQTESPATYVDNKPNRNAISKIYISRSYTRDLQPGDIIVFYRTAERGQSGWYTSVATTLGIVQNVILTIATRQEFIAACRKRSVFSDAELTRHWDYNRGNRPFVVNFLYVHALPKRPNLKELTETGIIQSAPRGFEPLGDAAFARLLEVSRADKRLIID